jgi:uncharacterized protein YndB with AHSA1/START domain
MWTTERSVEADVEPARIWAAWADVRRWPEWNGDIERVELRGPFAPGSTVAMTPRGQDPVELRLAEVVDGERFVDEAEVAGTVVRTTHRIERLGDDRARVVYRLEASGPAAEAIGPAISSDFDEVLHALVAHARG